MVTDTGGIDDRSFNASSWQGVQQAESATIAGKYLQSTTQSDYTPNINAFVSQQCGIIVTVGFLMGDATQTAAKANPNQKFAIVDYTYTPALANVDALLFNTVQDGFFGGYLAAGMTKSGKVATFGGQKLPTVTIYMDGFYDGVQYYNSKHGTHVKVLGWSEKAQNGNFTGDFTDQTKGQDAHQHVHHRGRRHHLPCRGQRRPRRSQGGAAGRPVGPAREHDVGRHRRVCQRAAVLQVLHHERGEGHPDRREEPRSVTAAGGTFKGGNYIGTLANGGVALAPYHDFASKVPAAAGRA